MKNAHWGVSLLRPCRKPSHAARENQAPGFVRPAAFVLVSESRRPYAVSVEFTLRNVTIFAGLDDDALSLLMARVRQTTVPAGGVIVREGEPGNQLYLIVSGAVRICKRFDRPDHGRVRRPMVLLNP